MFAKDLGMRKMASADNGRKVWNHLIYGEVISD